LTVKLFISFDYILTASGGVTNSFDDFLFTRAAAQLVIGRNDSSWGAPSNIDAVTDDGLRTGTLSMGMGYLTGDEGVIYLYNSAVVQSQRSQSAPVPEPATILLLGAGLIGLAGSKLRRKK
jgi:hypothetical protein